MIKIEEDQMAKLRIIAAKMGTTVEELMGNKKPEVIIEMIEDYDKKSKIKKIFEVLRKVVAKVGCHLIMIAQLNEDGTVKGGTIAPHLVDIVIELDVIPPDVAKVTGAFFLQIKKNRYGESNRWVCFRHYN